MPKELEYSCENGECTWRWDPNAFPVDSIRLRLRDPSGGSELREVPNTGRLVLPDDILVEEIVSTGEGGRGRAAGWREPE
ncbi:MAG TPA: hypothetical protein VF188_05645 [Longimicrobiales bacterium]